MTVKKIHISSFGTLTDVDIDPSEGLNVISGRNESGKTSVAMFIKFMLYGMPPARGGGVGERQKYVNWKTGEASGFLVVRTDDGREFRIERTLSDTARGGGKGQYRETVSLVNAVDGVPVYLSGSVGEYLLGVPEQVFVNTAFVRQATGVRPESEPLSRSVENMVTSADERVNVKKALEELDRARIDLLHKNRNGGMIKDLEEKRRSLRETVDEDRENSEETVRTEAALDEIRRKLTVAEENSKGFEGLFAALDVLSKKRKLDAAKKTAEDLALAEGKLEKERSAAPGDDFDGTVGLCERNIEAYSKAVENYNSTPDPDGEFLDDGDFEDDPFNDIRRAEGYRSSSRTFLTLGVVFAALGLLGAGAAAIMRFVYPMAEWLYAAAGGAALLLFSVIFFAVGGKKRSDLSRILSDWGAPSVDELAGSVRETVEAKKNALDMKARKEKAEGDLVIAEAAAAESREKLEGLAASLGIRMKDADDSGLLAAVRRTAAERRAAVAALESECSQLSGRLSALREQTAGIDPDETEAAAKAVLSAAAGQRAAKMTPDEIKEAARKRDFCRGSLIEMKKKENELDVRLAALKASAKSPAAAAERLGEIDSVLEDLRLRHDAYVTAYDALRRAGDNLRSGVLPEVKAKASEMMREISGGKYGELSISPGMDLYFTTVDAGTKEAEFMSSGTEDAAYLSLRLALIKTIFSGDGKSAPPVVFDESFARLDGDRLEAALRLLTSPSFGLQSFLCTCREEEADAAESAGGYVIRF